MRGSARQVRGSPVRHRSHRDRSAAPAEALLLPKSRLRSSRMTYACTATLQQPMLIFTKFHAPAAFGHARIWCDPLRRAVGEAVDVAAGGEC